ncbi:hypothetical protein [Streptomyces sp. NPDC046197]|uniref:hypothetical protein n=1 Tax=Streptomyces sp. NPDC046197 TaxID=3154337 RepID=UPI0033C0918C
MSRTTRAGAGMLPVAVLALLAAGCGTQHPGDTADAYRSARPTPTAISTPSTPVDFPCPGESAAPSAANRSTPPTPAEVTERAPVPTATAPTAAATATTASEGPGTPITDHYAENHGFMVPIPLHGKARCDGLAAVRRIEKALEPLRKDGDFKAPHTSRALTALGYAAGKVRVDQDTSVGVDFLIDAPTMCLEGHMTRESTQADAFGGYPDHSGCDQPSGGH